MSKYDETNRGVLFTNNRKGNERHPDFTGRLNVDGKDFEISGWKKKGKNGDFIGLSVKPPYQKPQEKSNHPLDDEISF